MERLPIGLGLAVAHSTAKERKVDRSNSTSIGYSEIQVYLKEELREEHQTYTHTHTPSVPNPHLQNQKDFGPHQCY